MSQSSFSEWSEDGQSLRDLSHLQHQLRQLWGTHLGNQSSRFPASAADRQHSWNFPAPVSCRHSSNSLTLCVNHTLCRVCVCRAPWLNRWLLQSLFNTHFREAPPFTVLLLPSTRTIQNLISTQLLPWSWRWFYKCIHLKTYWLAYFKHAQTNLWRRKPLDYMLNKKRTPEGKGGFHL